MIPKIFSSNPRIDLKSALLSDVEKKELPKEVKVPKHEEEFIPKFIDCDREPSSVKNDAEKVVICTNTLADLLNEKLPVQHSMSMMGKILGNASKKRFHTFGTPTMRISA